MRASPSTERTNVERIGPSDVERLMRRQKIAVWVVILIVLCAVTSFSSGNRSGARSIPSVPDAVRSATTPLSSYEDGLVNTPDPIDNSSALAVTGNVTGGKHFRGNLPYRSPTSIDAPLGSTSIDPFMRRTTPSPTAGGSVGMTSPYYSPTGTATSGAVNPSLGTAYTEAPSPSGSTRPSRLTLAPDDVAYSNSAAMSPTGAGSDLQAGWQVSAQPTGGVSREDYDRQLRQLQEKLAQVKAEVAELERGFAANKERIELAGPSRRPDVPAGPDGVTGAGSSASLADASRRQELLQETARLLAAAMGLPDETSGDNDAGPGDADAALAAAVRPRLQLYEEQGRSDESAGAGSSIDALVSPRKGGTSETDAGLTRNEWTATPPANQTFPALDPTRALLNRPPLNASPSQEARSEDLPSGYRILGQDGHSALSPVDSAAKRKSAPEPTNRPTPSVQPSSDPSSAAAFDRYLHAGRQLVQQGHYHRAAEAFTLASAYRPNDARAYLGKGHALLAAGEYLDSALFVAKAVEHDLPRVLQRIDLIQLAGGADAFVMHVNELTRLAETQDAPQLQFLMAYIYYQMDRPQEAKVAIDAAQKQLPSSMPIDLLRSAICQ